MRTTVALLLAFLAPPVAAQSTGPQHTGYDPNTTYVHKHEGELGEKLRYVEQNLKCSCGCILDTHTCQLNMQCGVSPRWSEQIYRRLTEGAAEQEILDEFVVQYGQVALIAPPLEGFNWVGYLTPAVALLLGGALVGLVLRRNVGAHTAPTEAAAVSSDEWDRLQSEIRKIEEEEASSDW